MTKTAVVLLALSLAACGDEANRLYGSVSEVYPLDFQKVTVSLLGNSLVVEYLKGTTMADGIATKLTLDMTGLQITPNQTIDLTQTVGNTTRGTLEQIMSQAIMFPMKVGTLKLSSTPTASAPLTGHFASTLSNPDGRTLNGDFSATVIQL